MTHIRFFGLRVCARKKVRSELHRKKNSGHWPLLLAIGHFGDPPFSLFLSFCVCFCVVLHRPTSPHVGSSGRLLLAFSRSLSARGSTYPLLSPGRPRPAFDRLSMPTSISEAHKKSTADVVRSLQGLSQCQYQVPSAMAMMMVDDVRQECLAQEPHLPISTWSPTRSSRAGRRGDARI